MDNNRTRIIYKTVKDDTGAFTRPETLKLPTEDELTYSAMLEQAKLVLYREVTRLVDRTAKEGPPLSKDDQTALVNYIKILKDLDKEERTLLKDLSDDKLKKLANK